MSLHHRTNDPILRAQHIADRLEHQHERDIAERTGMYPSDWPNFWIKQFDEIMTEFCDPSELAKALGETQ